MNLADEKIAELISRAESAEQDASYWRALAESRHGALLAELTNARRVRHACEAVLREIVAHAVPVGLWMTAKSLLREIGEPAPDYQALSEWVAMACKIFFTPDFDGNKRDMEAYLHRAGWKDDEDGGWRQGDLKSVIDRDDAFAAQGEALNEQILKTGRREGEPL